MKPFCIDGIYFSSVAKVWKLLCSLEVVISPTFLVGVVVWDSDIWIVVKGSVNTALVDDWDVNVVICDCILVVGVVIGVVVVVIGWDDVVTIA